VKRCHRRFCAVVKNLGERADAELARGAVSGGTGRCVAQTVRDQGVCAPEIVRVGARRSPGGNCWSAMGVAAGGRAPAVPRNTAGPPFLGSETKAAELGLDRASGAP